MLQHNAANIALSLCRSSLLHKSATSYSTSLDLLSRPFSAQSRTVNWRSSPTWGILKASLFCCTASSGIFMLATTAEKDRVQAEREARKQRQQQQGGFWPRLLHGGSAGSSQEHGANRSRPPSMEASSGSFNWPWSNSRKSRANGSQDNQSPSSWVASAWHHATEWYQDQMLQWQHLSRSQKLTYGIITINAVIFAAWQMPRLQGSMLRHFALELPTSSHITRSTLPHHLSLPSPATSWSASRPWTLLTSNFSHQSAIHLTVNMAVLHSFVPLLAGDKVLGTEQLAAVFVTSGLAATWASSVGRLLLRLPGQAAGGYSLGASGCLYGCVGLAAVVMPHQEIGVMLMPQWHAPISDALPVLLAVDLVGLLVARVFGWALLDHLAHLGGAGFGILYGMYGETLLWQPACQVGAALGL